MTMMELINQDEKETATHYQKKINSMISQPNGIFVVGMGHQKPWFHLIQFDPNYLILSCCFKKVVLAKLSMEGILLKLDGFSNFLFLFS